MKYSVLIEKIAFINIRRPQIVKRILTLLFFALCTVLNAQHVGNETGPPPPNTGGQVRGPELPIDQGLLILILIGLVYGIYTIRKNSTTNQRS